MMHKRKQVWIHFVFGLANSVIIAGSLLLAGLLRYGSIARFLLITNGYELFFVECLSGYLAIFSSKLYKNFYFRSNGAEFILVIIYNVWILVLVILYAFSTKNRMELSRLTFLYFLIFNISIMFLTHTVVKKVHRYFSIKSAGWKSIIISDDDMLNSVYLALKQNEILKHETLAIYVINGGPEYQDVSGVMHLNSKINIVDYVVQNPVDEIVFYVSTTTNSSSEFNDILNNIIQTGAVVSIKIQMSTFENASMLKIKKLGDSYFASYALREYDYFALVIKRLMDIIGALIGLTITFVIGIFVAPAILIESNGPLIFKQKRVGRNGRVFMIYKFRSMQKNAESIKQNLERDNKMSAPIFKIDNDPRITKVGKFIRKTSIDELPQFYNVLIGQMSLVGTRPPTLGEYSKYANYHKRRLSFKPGITGLWQTSGRNDILDFDEITKLDEQYIREWSVLLDCQLILKTIVIVFKGRGAV